MSTVQEIEHALWALWSHFGRAPGSQLHDDDALLWFETLIDHLPYNGVLRTRLDEASADAAIARVADHMQRRGAQFFWVDHPTATPADLGERLEARGVTLVERITGMVLELGSWTPPALPEGVRFEEVLDDGALDVYSGLTVSYWDLPPEACETVRAIHRHWGPERLAGHRYLAYIDGEPAGKGYIALHDPPGVAAIFGMSVLPAARRRGVAAGLTATLVTRAAEAGCDRVVLHATEMATELYRRAGFEDRCSIGVHATAQLWAGDH